jgi:retron-type reverse transcriptase
MENHGLDPDIIKWYKHYLGNRYCWAEVQEIIIIQKIARGTPQGGILSPCIWNLVFDSLLDQFDRGPIECVGFADDAGLVASGIDGGILAGNMQRAVTKVESWAR